MRHATRMVTVLLAVTLLAGLAGAQEANIQPSSPDDITLESSNGYEVTKQFDGTASTGDITSYTWDLVGSGQSDTGPQASFTFDREGSGSNTVRLTVSNATDSDVDEVTQVVHDVPEATISADGSTSINTGNSVSFSIDSTTNAFDGPLSYNWTVDGTSEGSGESFTHTFSSTGSFDVELVATDQAGEVGTSNTVTVSVSSSGNGGGGSGGGSGGYSSGGGGGFVLPSAAAVDITRTDGQFSVDVSNAEANTTINITLTRNASDDSGVGVDRVDIGVRKDGDFKVNVSSSSSPPSGTPEFAANGSAPRGYLQIDHDLSDADIDNATIRFRVNKSRLSTGDPANIVLNRYTGEWEPLDTEHVAEEAVYHVFEAESDGFSTFAVAEHEPRIAVTATAVDTTTVEEGGTLQVTATLTNSGRAAGEATVTFNVGGETAEQTVTVAANSQATVTHSATLDELGDHDVSVNGAAVDTVTVTDVEEPDPFQVPWLLIAAVLAVLLAGAVLYTQRDRIREVVGGEDDEEDVEDPLGPVRTD